MTAQIKIGDYIKSDFASFIQGTVVAMGTMGKGMPVYKIETPMGKTEYIFKGQALLFITPEEEQAGHQGWNRHD